MVHAPVTVSSIFLEKTVKSRYSSEQVKPGYFKLNQSDLSLQLHSKFNNVPGAKTGIKKKKKALPMKGPKSIL